MDSSSIMAISAIVVSVGSSILAIVNHKRIRSVCCGVKIETSLDIEDTTPPTVKSTTISPST